jgi:catechol 2,3-dioxygenase-like lactoylglutathione lyase family enzyme
MITGIHHAQITIPTGAEDEARAFYCRFLGLKEIPKPESLAGRGGFWLQLGAQQLHIGIDDAVERRSAKAHVAYLVEDIESWRSKLSAAHIDIVDGIPIPHYDRFEFRDPFGNRVEFLERADAKS